MNPHFIGIGAQKAGTTWLYHNLRKHPGLWMPSVKEIHYFDRSCFYASPSYLASNNLARRLFGKEWYNQAWRKYLSQSIRHDVRRPNLRRSLWNLRYFFGSCSDKWYQSLFAASKGRVAGEITPSYAMLDREDVGKVHCLLPELKIIFILRNPIERSWSMANAHFRDRDQVVQSDYVKLFSAKGSRLRDDYVRTLRNWKSFYDEEQIFVGFFDEIKENAAGFIKRVYAFLGVDEMFVPSDLEMKRNTTPYRTKALPDDLRQYLTDIHHDQLVELSGMFGSYADVWLEESGKAVAKPVAGALE